MSSSNYCFLTCIQVSQEAGTVVCYFHLFLRISQSAATHTVRGTSVVNEADVLLELSGSLYDPVDAEGLISGSSILSKCRLVHLEALRSCAVKTQVGEFWALLASVWDECNCAVVWAFLSIALLGDRSENWPFPVLWPLLSFPNLLAYWVQHFHSIIF